jgi:hypothetical protein
MAMGDVLSPATSMFSSGLGQIASYAWVLIPLILVIFVALGAWIYSTIQKKKKQWTHTLKVRRVTNAEGKLSDVVIHKMRRFPLAKKAEIFELETPLLGGYLIAEPKQYSGNNEFSIILDSGNRIYLDEGSYFDPESGSTLVSARHAEMDISRANMKDKWQQINTIAKRVEWSTIAKYAMIAIAIMAIMIVSVYGIQKWGENQKFQAEKAASEARAMEDLASAMSTIKATVNTQQLQITYLLEKAYNTTNIQGVLRST